MVEMTDREKYLFDVQGIRVVRSFLTPAEVARLTEASTNYVALGEAG